MDGLRNLTRRWELLAAAEVLEKTHPAAANALRSLVADEDTNAAPHLDKRRRILRRLYRLHFWHLDRRPAAEAIAQAWGIYRPSRQVPTEGTPEYLLAQLHASGFKPLKARQIVDDLDPALHKLHNACDVTRIPR